MWLLQTQKNENRPKDDVKAFIKIFPHQAIFRCSSYALASFKQISLTLLEVEIRSCGLLNGDLLADCVNIRVASLEDNMITSIPLCIQNLRHLEIVNFAGNDIENLQNLSNLRYSPRKLTSISLLGNGVTSAKYYRRRILQLVPFISALDNCSIEDEETLMYISPFKDKQNHLPRSCSMIAASLFYFLPIENPLQLAQRIDGTCLAVRRIRTAISPAKVIQRSFCRWFLMKREEVKFAEFVGAITKLQASVRYFLWSRKLKREIDSIVEHENINGAVMNTMSRVNQMAWRRQQIIKWCRRCLARKRASTHCTRIQRWVRCRLSYHKGLLLWLRRTGATGIFIAEPHLQLVRDRLAAYPQRFVNSVQIRGLATLIQRDERIVCVRSEQRNIFYRQGAFKRLFGPPKKRPHARTDVSVFSLNYANAVQRRRCALLKRRGVFYEPQRRNTWTAGARRRQGSGCDFISKHQIVYRLEVLDSRLLLKVFKYLQSHHDSIPLYFDAMELRQASATDIQRLWRSFFVRKTVSPLILSSIITRRSTLALQRWWRNINCLKRRLHLLRDINAACRGINAAAVYIDAWVFYHLLRTYLPPAHQRDVVSTFPEFKGIPLFDEKGHLAMQPYRQEKKPSVAAWRTEGSISIPVIPSVVPASYREGKPRACIPRWASWRPRRQLPPTDKPPLSHHAVLFSLLTLHCSPAMRALTVPFKQSHNLKRTREVRVMELTFSSVLEAQTRCAMLMLLTYDVKSHSSITLISDDHLHIRLRDKSDLILESRALVSDHCVRMETPSQRPLSVHRGILDEEREVFPIETQVLLCPVPPLWLADKSRDISSAEIVRFQFMCECLAAEDRRAKTASENFQEMMGRKEGSVKRVRGESDELAAAHDIHMPPLFHPLKKYLFKGGDGVGTESPSCPISVDTDDLPAAYTQQLMTVAKPRVVYDRPQSAATAVRQRPHSETRFKDKLWSKERVLLWCSNFLDPSEEQLSSPRTGTPARLFSSQPRAESRGHNACSAVESRLRTLKLSNTSKTLGKFRFDCIAPPQLPPPTVKRDDLLAARAYVKRLDVMKVVRVRISQEKKLAQQREDEVVQKQKSVKKAQEDKSITSAKLREWRSAQSSRARSRVVESLETAREEVAAQSHRNECLRSEHIQRGKSGKQASRKGGQARLEARLAGSALNSISSKCSKQARQREAKSEQQRRRRKGKNLRQEIVESEVIGESYDHHEDQSAEKHDHASSIKHMLLARYKISSSPLANAHAGRDDSLSLSSPVEHAAPQEDYMMNTSGAPPTHRPSTPLRDSRSYTKSRHDSTRSRVVPMPPASEKIHHAI